MRSFAVGAVTGAFGVVWAMGVLPGPIDNFLDKKLCEVAAILGFEVEDFEGGMTSDEGGAGNDRSGHVASNAADAVRRAGVFEDGHLSEVYTCPGMKINNLPAVTADGRLSSFRPVRTVAGVEIAVAPINHGCFSSGYGDRNGKLHKGTDYHSEEVSHVYAAGSGTIVEAVYREDYGNMVVIDHGNGVYTRYAHLKGFASGIKEGASVTGTTRLGRMGQSAGYKVVVHLHFELLRGDFNTPAKSFGLEPQDPLG